MTKWTNFHTHSYFCDGHGTLEEFVQAAISKNFAVLGFSSHSPVPYKSKNVLKFENVIEYLRKVQILKEKHSNEIEIYTGMEIDFFANYSKISQFSDYLDYSIGSVHQLGILPDGDFLNFDYSKTDFSRYTEEIFNGDIKNMVSQYYLQIILMLCAEKKPDIIGHLDLIKKFNRNDQFFSEKETWYKDLVLDVLHLIAEKSCVIEVNTRPMIRGLLDSFYPSKWILEESFRLNIPVTLNCDAHIPTELGGFYPQAAEMLLEIGYKEILILYKNTWQFVELSQNGLKI